MTTPSGPRDCAIAVIGDVRVTPVLISDPPLLNAQGVHQPYTTRLIVEVETTTGTVGLGETYGGQEYLQLASVLAPQLIGRPLSSMAALTALSAPRSSSAPTADAPFDVGSLTLGAGAQARRIRGGRSGPKLVGSVASAFEVALWDALGHELGVPVHALLGGKVRDRVDCSAYLFYRWAEHPSSTPGIAATAVQVGSASSTHSAGSTGRAGSTGGAGGIDHRGLPVDDWGAAVDPDGIVRQARRFAETYGFCSFKLKGGVFPPEEEVAAIRALTAEFPGMPLRLDPNGAWSVETSIKVATELADTLEYLEDPTLTTSAMAEVRRRTGMRLATNMCVTTFPEIPEAFVDEAVQVVLADHHYWGGLLASKDLAAVCRTFGVGLSMHSNTHLGISLAAMTHLAAAVPDLSYACDTHRPWQTEDVITTPHTFVDGAIVVSDSPGLGVTLDHDALQRLHERWRTADPRYRDRDDVAAMRIADPDWTKPTFPRW